MRAAPLALAEAAFAPVRVVGLRSGRGHRLHEFPQLKCYEERANTHEFTEELQTPLNANGTTITRIKVGRLLEPTPVVGVQREQSLQQRGTSARQTKNEDRPPYGHLFAIECIVPAAICYGLRSTK